MLHFVPTVITLSKPEIWAGQAYWLHDFSLFLCKTKFCILVWNNWNYFTVQLQRKAIFKKLVQTSCFYFYLAWGRHSVGCWPLLLFVLALVFCGTQSPVTFLGSFGPPFENSAGESHLSCQQGTACCALHLMALYKMQ